MENEIQKKINSTSKEIIKLIETKIENGYFTARQYVEVLNLVAEEINEWINVTEGEIGKDYLYNHYEDF